MAGEGSSAALAASATPPPRLADPQSLSTLDLHRRSGLTLEASSPGRTLARLVMELRARLVCALQMHTGNAVVSWTSRAAKMALQVDGLTSREPSMHSVGVTSCGGSSSAMPPATPVAKPRATTLGSGRTGPVAAGIYHPCVRPSYVLYDRTLH